MLLRALGGLALVRWFVASGDRVAYVTDDLGLEAMERNEPTNRVIGFPWEDVFLCQPGMADGARVDWSSETPATRH